MASGTVKWYDAKKQYGFIQPQDGSKDVFVHASQLNESNINNLVEGDKVSYELGEERAGKLSAVNIKKI